VKKIVVLFISAIAGALFGQYVLEGTVGDFFSTNVLLVILTVVLIIWLLLKYIRIPPKL